MAVLSVPTRDHSRGWPMWQRIAVRAALVPVIFVAVSASSFFLLYGPWGPDQTPEFRIQGPVPPELRHELRESLGLNDPLHEQYLRWLGDALRGDLGESRINFQPISQNVADSAPRSIEMLILAATVALLTGVALTTVMRRSSGWQREAVIAVAALISALPLAFTTALVIIVPYKSWGHSYPLGDYVSILNDAGQNLHLLGPPSIALGLTLSAVAFVALHRRRFSSPLETRALLEALLWTLPLLLTGAVLAESMFATRGLGNHLYMAAIRRDIPELQALGSIMITFGIVVVLFARLARSRALAPDPASITRTPLRLTSSSSLVAGCALIAAFFVVATIGAWLVDGGSEVDPYRRFAGPSWAHPFGSDESGQDLLDQTLTAARTSLRFVGAVLVLGFLPGVIIGYVASRRTGRTGDTLESMILYAAAVPSIVLAFALFVIAREDLRFEAAVASVVLVTFAAGLVTGLLTPNRTGSLTDVRAALPIVAAGACSVSAFAILFEAIVGYSGIYADRDSFTFGGLIRTGFLNAVSQDNASWHLLLAPGLTLTLIVLGFLLVALRLALWRHEAEERPAGTPLR